MDEEHEQKITQKATLTLDIVWVLCGAVAASIFYFATDHAVLTSQAQEIRELKQVQKDYQLALTSFNNKLIKIMTRLNIKDDDK